MALWPFRRKNSRKRSRSGAALSDGEGPDAQTRTERAMTRAVSQKKQRTEPAKLQRRPRAYSFSPGRRDSICIDPSRACQESAGRHGAVAGQGPGGERMPTLHHGHNQYPARGKSSKRRRSDHAREAEIKAMSACMSTRMATDACATWTVARRNSKRAKTTTISAQWNEPPSYVSLPLFDSTHSSQSSDSGCVSYKVSALYSLAPRPTLRYAAGSRWTPSRASMPTQSGSKRRSAAGREIILQNNKDSRKRIDDLADGLDASDLRELMERDNRRRQRRQQYDQARMERRLARKAEKQRREEAEANESGTPLPTNLERGVLGRELVGLGVEPRSAVVTSSKKRASTTPDPVSDVEEAQPKEPMELFHGINTTPQEESSVAEEPVIPQVYTVPPAEPDGPAPALTPSSILAGILRTRKSQSKSTLNSEKEKMIAEDDSHRKGSEGSTKTSRLSFASFLKWGARNRRSSGPSSFSNTSREEMQAAATSQAEALSRLQGDDVIPQGNYLAGKLGAGAPKRTQSRFREDLPDYPLSPPDSRVQSPEGEPSLAVVAEVKTPEMGSERTPPSRHDMPLSGARPMETISQRPTSMERTYGPVSPDPMSLATIDSEGSWLSGRVANRRPSTTRASIAPASRREETLPDSPRSSTSDNVLITDDDDYISQLTPDQNLGATMARCRSGDGRLSSGEEPTQADDVRWGAVGAKPQVIRFHQHDRETTRSREGLLNIGSGIEEDSEGMPLP